VPLYQRGRGERERGGRSIGRGEDLEEERKAKDAEAKKESFS